MIFVIYTEFDKALNGLVNFFFLNNPKPDVWRLIDSTYKKNRQVDACYLPGERSTAQLNCHYLTQYTRYGRGSVACSWHSPRHASTQAYLQRLF